MAQETLGRLENHTFYILFICILVIIFWQSVWELVADFVIFVEHRYGIKRWKVYSALLIMVILLIEFHPIFLDKI